ncbi:hypothetical protein DP62_5715 [Burkholderia pseudomallei]|nr:hypothetical protein DP62_5715 [Burkholderia pseudomallei]
MTASVGAFTSKWLQQSLPYGSGDIHRIIRSWRFQKTLTPINDCQWSCTSFTYSIKLTNCMRVWRNGCRQLEGQEGPYTEEFKSEAVRLAGTVGQRKAARRLGQPQDPRDQKCKVADDVFMKKSLRSIHIQGEVSQTIYQNHIQILSAIFKLLTFIITLNSLI